MDNDSFVLSFSEGKVPDEHMDLSILELPIKTKNKVPGKFKHELGSRQIEDFIALSANFIASKIAKTKLKGKK